MDARNRFFVRPATMQRTNQNQATNVLEVADFNQKNRLHGKAVFEKMRIQPPGGKMMNTAAAQTAVDNAVALMAILHAGIDALPAECRLADGIALVLDNLGAELDRARVALG